MKKWLDNYGKKENANEGHSSAPKEWIGEGYSNVGRNYSPAWGGQFQKGGTLSNIFTDNPNDPRLKRYSDSSIIHNYLQKWSDLVNTPGTTEEDTRKFINEPDSIAAIKSMHNTNIRGKFIKDVPLTTKDSTHKVSANIEYLPKPQPVLYRPNPELIPFNVQDSTANPQLRTIEQPNIELPAVQRGQYRTSYYDPQMKDWNERAFMTQKESDQFADEMSKRGYPGAYGNVTQRTQYQKGGALPPIYTDDPRKVKNYNDSLNVYNENEPLVRNYLNFINKNNLLSNSYVPLSDEKIKPIKGYDVIFQKNSKGEFLVDKNLNPTNLTQKDLVNAGIPMTVATWGVHDYKKPVQPYILQKEPKLHGKQLTHVDPISASSMTSTPGLRSMQHPDIQMSGAVPQGNWNVEYLDPDSKKTETRHFVTDEQAEEFYNDPANKASRKYSNASSVGRMQLGGNVYPVNYVPQAQDGISFLPQQDPEMMYTDRFNTQLNKDEQNLFAEWAAKESERQGRDIMMDKGAYDVQGFWKSGDYKRMVKGHGTDTWKKPNHPTFSNQSKYHGIDGFYGGNWTPQSGYQPSKQTADMYGPSYYNWLFGREPEISEHLDASRYMSGTNKPSPLYFAMGGKLSKAQKGKEVIIDGKEYNTSSDEYRDLYRFGPNQDGKGGIGYYDKNGILVTNKMTLPEVVIFKKDKDTKDYYDRLSIPDRYAFEQLAKNYGPVNVKQEEGEGMFSGTKGHYNAPSNTITVDPGTHFDGAFISELAHKLQYDKQGIFDVTGDWIFNDLPDYLTGEDPYKDPSAMEYEAHSKIEPGLRDEYYNYKSDDEMGYNYNKFQLGGSIPGSVGFTYARTNSPAPSNGPYAKKTKASAQDGKEVPIDPTTNPTYAQPLDESLQYVNDWMNSPMYKQMLSNSLRGRKRDYENLDRRRKSVVEDGKINYYEESIDPRIGAESNYVGKGKSNMYFNKDADYPDWSNNILHELFHITDAGGLGIPLSDKKLMYKYATHDIKDSPSYESAKATGTLDDLKKFTNYVNAPSETRARINNLRKLMRDQEVYDPFTQSFSKDMFDKYKQLDINEEDKKRGQTVGMDPYQQLRMTYTDEEIEDMMNKVSKNEDSEITPVAKNGQEMSYYQHGLDWKPKTISKNGGWLDKYIPEAQGGLNIPGVTDFKMPLNRTDAPGLSIQEKQKQDAAALEIQRRNDATAKRQFVGKGKASTKESEARRVMLNKQNTTDLPNVQMDQSGNTSRINPNMTYTGEPANFMGERQQKNYEHVMGALEAAGYLEGASALTEGLVNLLTKSGGKNINLQLFGFGRKKPIVSEVTPLSQLEKQALTTQEDLARANRDAITFSQSPANRAKLQEFRPGQDFSITNQQARFIDDPEALKLYESYKLENNPSLSIEQYLGGSRGQYGARDYGDLNDVVLIDKNQPFTSNIPSRSAYTDAMHETTHSRSIRLGATDAEKEIASDAWSPMIKKNNFGMPEEEAFAVQNELRTDKLKDIKGDRVYTEKDIPEIKKGLQEMINEGHDYLRNVNIEDFNIPALIKSLNKIGLGAAVIEIGGKAALQQKKKGGVIKDDRGQWDHPGEITEIGSNRITMQGVPYPVLGVSDENDVQMMYPGEEYKFKGKKVTEFPMAQDGIVTEGDSLLLYKNQLLKDKFYKNNPDYAINKNPNYNNITSNKDIPNLIKNINQETFNDRDNVYYDMYKDNFGKPITKKDLHNKFRKISNNVYSAGDLAGHDIDPWFNPDAPLSYFSNTIKPQKWVSYKSTRHNDITDVPMYDPLAVKPYNLRTPQEKIEWEKRYGKKLQSEPTLKRKPVKMETIKSKSSTSTPGIKTMSGTPVKEQPVPKRGEYRVSYYNPDIKDWSEQAFETEKESDKFADEMSKRGYGSGAGNVTQTRKVNKKENGGWLSQYK